jgi:hypothetical protein
MLTGRHQDALRLVDRIDDESLEGVNGLSPFFEFRWIAALVVARELRLVLKLLCVCSQILLERDNPPSNLETSPRWKFLETCDVMLSEWAEVSSFSWSAKSLLVKGLMKVRRKRLVLVCSL